MALLSAALLLGQPVLVHAQGGPAPAAGALNVTSNLAGSGQRQTSTQAQAPDTQSPKVASGNQNLCWDYGSERGPSQWGSLADAYRLCSCGRFQSPIALSEREALRFEYSAAAAPFEIRSNVAQWKRLEPSPPGVQPPLAMFEQYIPPPPPIVGDVPPVTGFEAPLPAATLILREIPPELPKVTDGDGTSVAATEAPTPVKLSDAQVQQYRLVNIHFHAPQSEHVIERFRGDLEMHAVFRNVADENDVAVIGRIWRAVPEANLASNGSGAGAAAVGAPDTAVPRWLDELLSLLDEAPAGQPPAQKDAGATNGETSLTYTSAAAGATRASVHAESLVADASNSSLPPSSTATSQTAPSRPGRLRTTRFVEFNFADTLLRENTAASLASRSPAGEIESGMALAAEELDPEARPCFFYYRGSLTMPPCSENIKWIVLTHRDSLPQRIVDRILAAQQGQPNVRPLQPRNERAVLYYTPQPASTQPLGS
jgi:carbonic anhydrase